MPRQAHAWFLELLLHECRYVRVLCVYAPDAMSNQQRDFNLYDWLNNSSVLVYGPAIDLIHGCGPSS